MTPERLRALHRDDPVVDELTAGIRAAWAERDAVLRVLGELARAGRITPGAPPADRAVEAPTQPQRSTT